MQSKAPLEGVKLTDILTQLKSKFSWPEIGEKLGINAFNKDASHKSCLRFLRKTPWARSRVEILYLKTFCSKHPQTSKLIRSILDTQKNQSDNVNDKDMHRNDKTTSESSTTAFQWAPLKTK